LRERIASRSARLAVVGLGYVGTPVACRFAQEGFAVLGVDVDERRVASLNDGVVPFDGAEPGLAELLADVAARGTLRCTTDYDALEGVDVVLVAVETPVNNDRKPGYLALRSALASVGARLWPGALVVVESTLAPGTMDGLVTSVLAESSGLVVGRDLHLAHCPERVMPGKLLQNLAQMSRVVGGTSPEAAETAAALYRCIVDGDLDTTDALTAELVKAGENAYRDVQIAFANEMALLCEDLGADVWRVRELVNKSPGRAMLLPGAGVGGHCIPKDPWLLIANAGDGFAPRLVPAARAVNDGMPLHVAALVRQGLAIADRAVEGARIAVLGYAYLDDSDDDRNSPSAVLVAELEAMGAEVVVHDPWVPAYRGVSLEDCTAGADALVVMVAHSAYRELDLVRLAATARTRVLVDGRRLVDRRAAIDAGWTVATLGVGARSDASIDAPA